MAHASKKTLAKADLGKGEILVWDVALDYILAGRAIVTLESVKDESRNTYLVEQVVDDVKDANGKVEKVRRQRWWVHLLVGSDNTRSYRYLGTIDARYGALSFRTTKGTSSNKGASAENINRIGDVVRDLVLGINNSHVTRVWHRGLCGHCGQVLTVPSSIATGIGPVCAKKLGIKMKNVSPGAIDKLAALAPSTTPENKPALLASA